MISECWSALNHVDCCLCGRDVLEMTQEGEGVAEERGNFEGGLKGSPLVICRPADKETYFEFS